VSTFIFAFADLDKLADNDVLLGKMSNGNKRNLADLQCPCANRYRYAHKLLKASTDQ
jgi:hypothetical protein